MYKNLSPDIVTRLVSIANHDGKVFPSGGCPLDELTKKLLLDSAKEIRILRRKLRKN